MNMYDVTFEDVGFTSRDLSGCELAECQGATFTASAKEGGTLPDGVEAVISGYISEDDDQPEDDRKVFVGVTVRVQAENLRSAENFPPPAALMNAVAERMAANPNVRNDLDLEGNWEVMGVEFVSEGDQPARPGLKG